MATATFKYERARPHMAPQWRKAEDSQMSTMVFQFDDLPLVIENGIPAGFINGQAEITYVRNGDWAISNITLEGFGQRNVGTGKREWPQVQAPASIAQIVRGRLHSEWFSKVQDAVNEAISEDRECAADAYADMCREARMVERV